MYIMWVSVSAVYSKFAIISVDINTWPFSNVMTTYPSVASAGQGWGGGGSDELKSCTF